MKNSKYIIALAALLIASVANATVRTLNNNNPTPGQYTNWIAVDAASSPNDTVYVSGSPINYGNILVTRPNLTIIGTGHNPQKQNPIVSQFGEISCNSVVNQLKLDGIICETVVLSPNLGGATIYVDNCKMIKIGVTSNSGYDAQIYLHNNILTGSTGWGSGYSFLVTNGDNLTGEISNNILTGNIRSSGGNEFNLSIFNNLFTGGTTSSTSLFYDPEYFYSSVIKNNIFMNYTGLNILYQNNPYYNNMNVTFENNIIYNTTGTLWNNLFTSTGTITANPLFINVPCTNNTLIDCPFNSTYDYHLSASSPGKNAGTDGTDIGPYGGTYGATFTTYGEPHIPQMKQMNMPATVVSGNTFNVNVISTVK